MAGRGPGRPPKHSHAGNPHHGRKASPTYVSWKSMRARCRCESRADYAYYGGRGIAVCPEWDDFATFLADMGARPEGTTLDRIDPDGNYEPSNCRWATPAVQGENRRGRWGKGKVLAAAA